MDVKEKQKEVCDFLRTLQWTWKIEININANTKTNFLNARWQQNIYFCCWFDSASGTSGRCVDGDFTKKKYIPVDIDIRLAYYEQHHKVLSQEELDEEILKILDRLDKQDVLKTYSYVIKSWNWVHIYYVWDEITIDRDTYSRWVEYIQWLINDTIDDLWYKCDSAVKNIWRIMRLPWTINPRKKTHWNDILWDLWPYECQILKINPTSCDLLSKLPEFAEILQSEANIIKIAKQNFSKSDSDKWWPINSVPISELVEFVYPVTALVDKEKNWIITIREQHKNMWAFIYTPYNIMVNWWSSLIKTSSKRTFTPYELILNEYCNWDVKKTLEFFKSKYNVEPKPDIAVEAKYWIKIPEKREYERKWFLYPDPLFDSFECFMSWELVTIVAETNSWKTTFAMDLIDRNIKEHNRKCLYINLEFEIEQVPEKKRMDIHWKTKLNLTDIKPLTDEEQSDKIKFISEWLNRFDYYNSPTWISLEELVQLLSDKADEWYDLIVIDTFSRIDWNLWNEAHSSQNKTMETLFALTQNTWLAIIMLHHTNRWWTFEWSQKIKDLSNVFIIVEKDEDWWWCQYTKYSLLKDKFVSNMEIDLYREKWKYYSFDSR